MTEHTNTPELRFPEFTEEWVITLLGEVSYITKLAGFEFTKYVNYSNEGKIPAIRGINIKNGRFNFEDVKYIDDSDFSKLSRSKLLPQDIVFTYVGTIGHAAIVPNDTSWYLAPNVAKIRSTNVYPDFLLQILTNPTFKRKEIFSWITTSSQPALSMANIRNFKLYLPSILEQKKVGIFFSKLDQQIELEEKKLELLEQQKRGYMQKIFSQEVRFKDDNGNSYPEWESAPLFDIFSATKGKSLSKDKISDDGKYECILYGEIYTTYEEKIESIVSRTNYYEGILSQKNDLIFPNSTTTNAWDLATFSSLQKNNVLIGGDISILRTKRSDISSLFYAYYLTNYLKLRKDIAKYAQGITIVHLSFNNFYKIKVQIPSLEEQNSITDFIDTLNQQQKLIANKIKLLKERKKGFLQKMFV